MTTLDEILCLQPYRLQYEDLGGAFNITGTTQLSSWMFNPEQVQILLPLASGSTSDDQALVSAARTKLKILYNREETVHKGNVSIKKPNGRNAKAFSYRSFTSLCPKHWGNPYWWDKGIQRLLIHTTDTSVPPELFWEIQKKYHLLSPYPYLLGEIAFHIKDDSLFVSQIQSDVMQHTAYIAKHEAFSVYRNRLVNLYKDWPYIFFYECRRRAIALNLKKLYVVTPDRQIEINKIMWGYDEERANIGTLFDRCYNRVVSAFNPKKDASGHYRVIELPNQHCEEVG